MNKFILIFASLFIMANATHVSAAFESQLPFAPVSDISSKKSAINRRAMGVGAACCVALLTGLVVGLADNGKNSANCKAWLETLTPPAVIIGALLGDVAFTKGIHIKNVIHKNLIRPEFQEFMSMRSDILPCNTIYDDYL